eukprot:scaffold251706_cov32-Tisochrysis_lutea.AAC.1
MDKGRKGPWISTNLRLIHKEHVCTRLEEHVSSESLPPSPFLSLLPLPKHHTISRSSHQYGAWRHKRVQYVPRGMTAHLDGPPVLAVARVGLPQDARKRTRGAFVPLCGARLPEWQLAAVV